MSDTEPHTGIWRLNVSKSKASDPGVVPRSETLRTEALESGLQSTFDFEGPDGKAHHTVWSVNYDGKDHVTTGDLLADTVATTKIDANTLLFVNKRGGKEVAKWRSTVSKDGKIQTWTGDGRRPNGQTFSAPWVYEKE